MGLSASGAEPGLSSGLLRRLLGTIDGVEGAMMQVLTYTVDPALFTDWFGKPARGSAPFSGTLTLKGTLNRAYLPSGEATPLLWHPSGALLCTSYKTALWDRNGHLVHYFNKSPSCGLWSPDGASLVHDVRNIDNSIKLYHAATATVYELHDCPPLYALVFHPTAPVLTLVTPHTLYYWDFLQQQLGTIPCPQITSPSVATWSPDGAHLILTRPRVHDSSTNPDFGSMDVYDRRGRLVGSAPPHYQGRILSRDNQPSWHPSSSLFVTSHAHGLIWWKRDGTLLAETPIEITEAFTQTPAWNRDGTHVAVVGAAGLSLVRADGRVERLIAKTVYDGTIAGVDWHPDGRHLAVGRWASRIELWNMDGTLQTLLSLGDVDAGAGPISERLARTGSRAPLIVRWDPCGTRLACALRDFSVEPTILTKVSLTRIPLRS